MYEVMREIYPYLKEYKHVRKAYFELSLLSSMVYQAVVTRDATRSSKSNASSKVQGLQSLLTKLSLSDSVTGIENSPETLLNSIMPASVTSAAEPRPALMKNISKDDVPQGSGDVNENQKISKTSESEQDEEVKAIRETTIAGNAFMKAPNGEPTNLTERQWLQVRTWAFKRWFGNWEREASLTFDG